MSHTRDVNNEEEDAGMLSPRDRNESAISLLPSFLEADFHDDRSDIEVGESAASKKKRFSQNAEMLSKALDSIMLDGDPNDIIDKSGSYATSVTSSAQDYRYELGRRYHAYKAGTYQFPNDEAEIKRLDFQNEIFKVLFNDAIYFAPISNPQNILDLGTGTGTWAIEMAELFPTARILGNDLSPIQPVWVPPNVLFEVDDIEEPWPYHRTFDLIHSRYLTGSVKDWPALCQQAYEFCAPGGWLELVEVDCKLRTDDGTLDPYSALARWSELLIQATERFGASFRAAPRLAEMVREAGFHGVKARKYKMPISPWPKLRKMKEVGAMQMCNMLDGVHAVSLKLFTETLGWGMEELEELLEGVTADVTNLRIHCYYTVYVIIAQKR